MKFCRIVWYLFICLLNCVSTCDCGPSFNTFVHAVTVVVIVKVQSIKVLLNVLLFWELILVHKFCVSVLFFVCLFWVLGREFFTHMETCFCINIWMTLKQYGNAIWDHISRSELFWSKFVCCLITNHSWLMGIHVYSNEGPHPSPREDNNEIIKKHQ